MTDLSSLPPLREVIAQFDLLARKSLGQHFLCDLSITDRIATSAGSLDDCTVFEIGPGPGGLTRALLSSDARQIIAIEKDRRCLPALEALSSLDGRLSVIEGDALQTDLTTLGTAPRAIVANLPYNIGTELLLTWLKQMPAYRSMTLMFQAEVADRLTAVPGTKAYGRLSVITQFCCEVQKVFSLPPGAFSPPPKVSSTVVRLTPRLDQPADVVLSVLEQVTAVGFGQRRKMLRSSLKVLGGEELLRRANINPELRAENLSLRDFETLARLVSFARTDTSDRA